MKKKISKIEKFRYLLKKNKRFRFVMITLAIALGIVLFGLLSFLMVRLESADKVTAAISVEPEKLDPTFCSDTETETVIVNCFEGLMKIDENGNAVKAAADGYTVSEDGLVYTFTFDYLIKTYNSHFKCCQCNKRLKC